MNEYTRGVEKELRAARALGLVLCPKPAGTGVRIEHGAFLVFAEDATEEQIRSAVAVRDEVTSCAPVAPLTAERRRTLAGLMESVLAGA